MPVGDGAMVGAELFDVLEAAGILVLWAAEDGRITRASSAAADLLGRTPEELAGRSRFEFLHPADSGPNEPPPPVLGSRDQPPVRRVRRWRHADGSWRWLESAPVDARSDPRVGGFVSVLRDVTVEVLVRRISETVQSDGGLDAAFASVAAALGDVLAHQTAMLSVLTPEGIVIRAVEGTDEARALVDKVLPLSLDAENAAHTFAQPIVCTDVTGSPNDPFAAAIAPARAYATFPIRVGGALVGSVTLLSRSPAFTAAEPIAAVAAVVEQTGGLLFLLADLARQRRVAQGLRDSARLALAEARTDPLTGLANRRAWEEGLAGLIARAGQDCESLSIVMLDLDGLKAVNDADGHQAGDALLRSLGQAWRSQVRPGDLFARYGGDEFALALWACPAANAAEVVAGLSRLLPDGCSVSAGIAAWDDFESSEHLLGRADGALYIAKRNGRGLTVLASEHPGELPAPAEEGATVLRLPLGRSSTQRR